jgi:hypothetical protein
MRQTIELAVGGVFVACYSAHRFNTPSTNRSSTTAGRYFPAVCLYCGAALLTYAALVYSPNLVSFVIHGSDEATAGLAQQLSVPLFVALLMTVLLPKLPMLSTINDSLCSQLWHLASIPAEVRRLSAQLRRQTPRLEADRQAEIRRRLVADGFDERDVQFEGAGIQARWTLLSALFEQLDRWEVDRRMAAYLAESGESLQGLRTRLEPLRTKAKTCFRLLRDTSASAETDKAREAARAFADDFADQAAQLHRDLLDFVSRGVLRAAYTEATRQQCLAALGFEAGVHAQEFTLDEMTTLFMVVATLLIVASTLFSSGDGTASFGVRLARAIMVAGFYSIAVACVVYPKERWSCAHRERARPRPVAFYLLAGLMAAAITQAIAFAFLCLLERSVVDGARRWTLTYPWMLLTFTTSLATGVLVDDAPSARWPRLQRLLEGAIGATLLALAGLLTHRWLIDALQNADFRPPGYQIPPLGGVVVVSGLVGAVVGVFVPHWHRNAPRRSPPPDDSPDRDGQRCIGELVHT